MFCQLKCKKSSYWTPPLCRTTSPISSLVSDQEREVSASAHFSFWISKELLLFSSGTRCKNVEWPPKFFKWGYSGEPIVASLDNVISPESPQRTSEVSLHFGLFNSWKYKTSGDMSVLWHLWICTTKTCDFFFTFSVLWKVVSQADALHCQPHEALLHIYICR